MKQRKKKRRREVVGEETMMTQRPIKSQNPHARVCVPNQILDVSHAPTTIHNPHRHRHHRGRDGGRRGSASPVLPP